MGTEFDEQLKSRLLAFQKAHGITESGTTDSTTWTKLVGGTAGPASAGGAAAAADVLIGQVVTPGTVTPTTVTTTTQGLPEIRWLKTASDVVGRGFGRIAASGEVSAGGATMGQGGFATAEAGSLVTGPIETLAQGAITVGDATVAEGMLISGGTYLSAARAMAATAGRAAAAGAVATGWAVVGMVVVLGVAYLVVEVQEHKPPSGLKPGEEYPDTALPGGAPPQVIAPGTTPSGPGQAPGPEDDEPKRVPGSVPPWPVKTPGASQQPVKAPGVVDDPDECLRLIKAGVTHDHHIFPKQFADEFIAIEIIVDEFTVTLDATEHIGKNGVHTTLDWNGEWYDFFADFPRASLTDAQASKWHSRAKALATELMHRAKMTKKPMHWYRKPNKPSGK
jgi:hypothetical protein